GFFAEGLEPGRIDRRRETRTRPDQAHILCAGSRIVGERSEGKERRAKQRRADETLHARDPFVADAFVAAMPTWLLPAKERPADQHTSPARFSAPQHPSRT